jgi:hypothetical protein
MADVNETLARLQKAKGAPTVRILDETVKKKNRYGEEEEGPNPEPTYRYLYEDGSHVDVKAGKDKYEMIGGTALASASKAADADPNKPIEVSAGSSLVAKQPDGSYKPVYSPSADQGQKPMSAYEQAQVTLRQAADKAEAENREITRKQQERTITVAEANAARAEMRARIETETAQARVEIERQQLQLQQQNAQLANRREDRLVSTSEAQIGQNAAKDAIGRAQMSRNQSRSQAYGAARAAGGDPMAAMNAADAVPGIDFDAIAEAAAQRAIQGLQGLTARPTAPAPMAGAPQRAPVAAAPVAPPPPVAQAPLPTYTGPQAI